MDALLHAALGESLEQHCTCASEVYRLAYLHLDGGLGGYGCALPVREVVEMGERMRLDADAVEAALDAMATRRGGDGGGDRSNVLSVDEFVALMSELDAASGGGGSDDASRALLDAATAQARGLPASVAALISTSRTQPIDEVEDDDFQAYLLGLPGIDAVRQARTTEAQDASFLDRMRSS
eukprot:213665-Chlamydomonas_euryale.AAC.1